MSNVNILYIHIITIKLFHVGGWIESLQTISKTESYFFLIFMLDSNHNTFNCWCTEL